MSYKLALTIAVLNPRPSMNQTSVDFVGTYQEAVTLAQAAWRMTGRSTTVFQGTYCFYHITSDGVATDKNFPNRTTVEKLALGPGEGTFWSVGYHQPDYV